MWVPLGAESSTTHTASSESSGVCRFGCNLRPTSIIKTRHQFQTFKILQVVNVANIIWGFDVPVSNMRLARSEVESPDISSCPRSLPDTSASSETSPSARLASMLSSPVVEHLMRDIRYRNISWHISFALSWRNIRKHTVLQATARLRIYSHFHSPQRIPDLLQHRCSPSRATPPGFKPPGLTQ